MHVGFAISQVDEASALESLAMFRRLGTLQAELNAELDAEADRVEP